MHAPRCPIHIQGLSEMKCSWLWALNGTVGMDQKRPAAKHDHATLIISPSSPSRARPSMKMHSPRRLYFCFFFSILSKSGPKTTHHAWELCEAPDPQGALHHAGNLIRLAPVGRRSYEAKAATTPRRPTARQEPDGRPRAIGAQLRQRHPPATDGTAHTGQGRKRAKELGCEG